MYEQPAHRHRHDQRRAVELRLAPKRYRVDCPTHNAQFRVFSVPVRLQVLQAVVRQTDDTSGGMRLLVVLLSAGLTWCGLIIGVAVGVAFGTLASLSTFFLALHQPELRRALVETAEQSAVHFIAHPSHTATAA